MKRFILNILCAIACVGCTEHLGYETIEDFSQSKDGDILKLYYTTSDNKILSQLSETDFGATIIAHTYEDGQGVILFDTPITSIGDRAFYYCTSLTSVTIPDSVTSIGDRAFRDCRSLTSVTIPDSVTLIGDYAFEECTSLASVTIPDSVTSIGYDAFCGCTSLTSVIIGNSVTLIGGWAFEDCNSLTSVTIPDSVISIGDRAFESCKSLTSITIGNSVTSIGSYAFSLCISLTSVYCKPTTPPAGGPDMFGGNATGRKIYVPRNSVNAYKAARYWSDYASSIEGYDF